jgi:hypothetical protein
VNFQFAVLLVMFNKAALSSYNFPCANVVTLLQVLNIYLFYLRSSAIPNGYFTEKLLSNSKESIKFYVYYVQILDDSWSNLGPASMA